MQACYVNTTHPDFLNGHKAMALVNDRLNANKQPQHGEKSGKVTSAQLNNNRDLDVDAKEEQSFFGSFFQKGAPKKKGAAIMEAVSTFSFRSLCVLKLTSYTAPVRDQAPGGVER